MGTGPAARGWQVNIEHATLAVSGLAFQAGLLLLLRRACRGFRAGIRASRQAVRKTYKLRAAFTVRPVWQEGSTVACRVAVLLNTAGRAVARLLWHNSRYCPYHGGAEFDHRVSA